MPLKKLMDYLDDNGKKYVVQKHSKAYTAQEVAASAHIPGQNMAKTVMVKVDGDLTMVVVDSNHDVDLDGIAEALGAKEVTLASEDEFGDTFPDCDLGAMPPFGNLYEVSTYVAESLSDNEEIAFNAGSHNELVKMGYQDFAELVQPEVLPVAARYR